MQNCREAEISRISLHAGVYYSYLSQDIHCVIVTSAQVKHSAHGISTVS